MSTDRSFVFLFVFAVVGYLAWRGDCVDGRLDYVRNLEVRGEGRGGNASFGPT